MGNSQISRSKYLFNNWDSVNDSTIVDIFHDTALIYPDHVAVEDGDGAFTYRELDEYSNHYAAKLMDEGLKKGDTVVIKTGRSRFSILAILSIWKAGGAYLYLDDFYPEARNRALMEDTGAKLTLDSDYFDKVPPRPLEKYINATGLKELALYIYTSGSTSRPKGVMIEHGNITGLAENFHRLGLTENDRLGLFPSMAFVASVSDICCSLSVGATIVMIPEDRRRNIDFILEFIRIKSINIQFLPPHMAQKLMDLDTSDLSLKVLLVGSESVRNLKPKNFRILNVYAASEMCSLISVYEINSQEKSYPIGTLNPNLKGYIVNDEGQQVLKGNVGELWLSGNQVTRGYLNRPELTDEHYIPNPFSNEPGYERVYKTGDMVCMEEDNLRYICRKDNMYKIRGFRVEGGAVEATMIKCSAIKEAAVVAFEDNGGTNILVGYYSSDEDVDVKILKEKMKEYLPYYMIPTAIIQMEALPRNANNKIDRKALVPPKELNDHKLLEKLY